MSKHSLKQTFEALMRFKPCFEGDLKATLQANSRRWGGGWYARGDETAEFFTEAVLYTLIGKDDARTLLELLDAVGKELGVEVRYREEPKS